jgi:uncharacterized protein (TIGR02266 family)
MPQEERGEPRYRVDIRVDCVTRELFVANRMMNISRGGFFIEANLPLHSEVDLVFRVPGSGDPIAAKGRVVWSWDTRRGSARLLAGSGIRFTDMAPKDRQALEFCLRRLGEDEPSPDGTDPVWELLTTPA